MLKYTCAIVAIVTLIPLTGLAQTNDCPCFTAEDLNHVIGAAVQNIDDGAPTSCGASAGGFSLIIDMTSPIVTNTTCSSQFHASVNPVTGRYCTWGSTVPAPAATNPENACIDNGGSKIMRGISGAQARACRDLIRDARASYRPTTGERCLPL